MGGQFGPLREVSEGGTSAHFSSLALLTPNAGLPSNSCRARQRKAKNINGLPVPKGFWAQSSGQWRLIVSFWAKALQGQGSAWGNESGNNVETWKEEAWRHQDTQWKKQGKDNELVVVTCFGNKVRYCNQEFETMNISSWVQKVP